VTTEQLRTALKELNGERDATFAFTGLADHAAQLTVHGAMLIPDEPDHLVKVTDGRSVYILEAERVTWIRISLGHKGGKH
jgi:hypothetical protein